MSAYVQVHPNESKKQCWEVYEEEMKPEKGRVCARERMRKKKSWKEWRTGTE